MMKKNLSYSIVHLLALFLTMPAFSVTEQVLHTFTGVPDGLYPLSRLLSSGGKLYGTTTNGGTSSCKCGTVFELAPIAGGGWNYKILYSFTGSPDGSTPLGELVRDAKGNIYGAAGSGGHGFGAIWELSPTSGGNYAEKVIYRFKVSPDGNGPVGLISDSAGNLYGTTNSGGNNFLGTVFELSPAGNGTWTETVLHRFDASDGDSPRAELIFDAAGNLYGTTISGGVNSYGVVFELSPGVGGWTEQVLYNFTGGDDQGLPSAPLYMDANGNLFGTTPGAINNVQFGTVFELSPNGSGGWTETTLHTFGLQQSDGSVPAGGLAADANGNLYGTTANGGNGYAGMVYKLTPAAGGGYNYSHLYVFTGGSDGGHPSTGVTIKGTNIFGGTIGGPANGKQAPSVIYELKP